MALKKKKRTLSECELELKFHKTHKHIEGAYSLIGKGIYAGAAVLVFRYLTKISEAFAGLNTTADIMVSLFANVNVYVAWGFGIGGILYGLRQQKLKQDTIERHQTYTANLETELDKNRSSSGLTTRGNTNPEDIL